MRRVRAALVVLGLVGLPLGSLTLLSGCGNEQQTGTTVTEDPQQHAEQLKNQAQFYERKPTGKGKK
jgi:hypothetical protein